MKPFLTTTELLDLLSISRTTLFHLRKGDDFPAALKIGKRRLLWDHPTVLAWIASK